MTDTDVAPILRKHLNGLRKADMGPFPEIAKVLDLALSAPDVPPRIFRLAFGMLAAEMWIVTLAERTFEPPAPYSDENRWTWARRRLWEILSHVQGEDCYELPAQRAADEGMLQDVLNVLKGAEIPTGRTLDMLDALENVADQADELIGQVKASVRAHGTGTGGCAPTALHFVLQQTAIELLRRLSTTLPRMPQQGEPANATSRTLEGAWRDTLDVLRQIGMDTYARPPEDQIPTLRRLGAIQKAVAACCNVDADAGDDACPPTS